MRYYIVGGDPNGMGGGLIEVTVGRYNADRRAAYYVSIGYRDVRVMNEDDFYGGC